MSLINFDHANTNYIDMDQEVFGILLGTSSLVLLSIVHYYAIHEIFSIQADHEERIRALEDTIAELQPK